MSIDILGPVFYLPLEAHLKLVLAALADNANDDGICWPSQTTLALKASISERSVRDHLKLLESQGWLYVLLRGNGRGNPTHYALNIERINAEAIKIKKALKATPPQDKMAGGDDRADTHPTVKAEKAEPQELKAEPCEPPNRHIEPPFSGGHPQTPVPPSPPDGDNGVLSPPNSKKSRTPPKPPDPLHPEVKLVFEGLKARRSFNSPAAAAEASAIRWMLKQGYPSGEQLACYDYLKSQSFWADKPVLMPSVKTQIGEWKKNGKTERANEGNTSRGAPSAIPGQRPGGAFDDID